MKQNILFNVLIELKKSCIDNMRLKDMTDCDGKNFTRDSPLNTQRLFTIIMRCCNLSGLQIKLDILSSAVVIRNSG